MLRLDNVQVAERLREAASLLEQQGANPFRVNAYRQAALLISDLDDEVGNILDKEGTEGLVCLPGIGKSIASAIEEMETMGRWSQLDRLRGASAPENLFQTIPGIGPILASHINDELHVDSLEALELAAHDGRLGRIPGIGPGRLAMIRASLAQMLARRTMHRRPVTQQPPVAMLLSVDREYRRRSDANDLPKIASRRFNPSGEAWLPILHTERDRWHFTALFSNTARAHELDLVFDWVLLYFHTDNEPEGQSTVVTETRGSLEGRRVVRGREAECRSYYEGKSGNGSREPV